MNKISSIIIIFAIAHPVFAEGNYGGGLASFLLYAIAIIVGILFLAGILVSSFTDNPSVGAAIFILAFGLAAVGMYFYNFGF